jgi:hypothetical protein
MGPIGCPETSARSYHYSLRNNAEERSSPLLRGGSLKSRSDKDKFTDIMFLTIKLHWIKAGSSPERHYKYVILQCQPCYSIFNLNRLVCNYVTCVHVSNRTALQQIQWGPLGKRVRSDFRFDHPESKKRDSRYPGTLKSKFVPLHELCIETRYSKDGKAFV